MDRPARRHGWIPRPGGEPRLAASEGGRRRATQRRRPAVSLPLPQPRSGAPRLPEQRKTRPPLKQRMVLSQSFDISFSSFTNRNTRQTAEGSDGSGSRELCSRIESLDECFDFDDFEG